MQRGCMCVVFRPCPLLAGSWAVLAAMMQIIRASTNCEVNVRTIARFVQEFVQPRPLCVERERLELGHRWLLAFVCVGWGHGDFDFEFLPGVWPWGCL